MPFFSSPFPPPAVVRALVAVCCFALAACGGGGGGAAEVTVATPAAAVSTSAVSTLTLTLPRHGLAAADLGVIVAEGDPLSEAVALYYQAARGVPAANIIKVKLPTGGDAISAADFAAVKAEVDAKLPAGVQATLVTWAAPSRVSGGACSMSLTSALAFGFDAKYCGGGCATTAASPYFDTESSAPWTEHKIRPAMMLGARTLDAAKALIDRGVRADGSQPSGDGYLLRTDDTARSVRYTDYTALPALWSGTLALNYVDSSASAATNNLRGVSNVLFYFTGLAQVANITSNTFRPGAVADHLTSYGGLLPGAGGQMPATNWLDAGATASYGTVEEPCNFTQKFSRASVLIDQYWRGATVIEAYWKSVEWPGQGLFLGEPLARPFSDSASFVIDNGQYLISTRALRPNSRYALEYRMSASGSWTSLASFTTPKLAAKQALRAPLPPAEATQLRWIGPCATSNSQQCTLASSS